MRPGRRPVDADPDDPDGDVRGDVELAAGRELTLPPGYWNEVAELDALAEATRTRRVPLTLAVVTFCVGAGAWGVVLLVDVLFGPDVRRTVQAVVVVGSWLAVPIARTVLRERIDGHHEECELCAAGPADDEPVSWARTWWVAMGCAAAWVDVVVGLADALLVPEVAFTACGVLALGAWLLAAPWNAAHAVRDPGEGDEPPEPAADPIELVGEVVDDAPTDAELIERDWAEYVADGEHAIARGSELHDRGKLPHGWRWTVHLDRRGSVNCSGLIVDGVNARVAHKLEMRHTHVMLERLPDDADREHLATLTVVTRDVLADGVGYRGPNYRDGVIRVGQHADGSGGAEWIAYNHTGVQSGLITGDPRSGKSAFLAKLAGDFKSSGEWVVLFADGDPAGGSAPVLAEIADDLARGNDEILQQLEALEAVQRHVRGDLMGTLTIGPDGKPRLARPDETPADKMLPCPDYPGLAWFLDEFHIPAAAMRSVNFAARVEKVVRGLAKYGLAVIVSTQSKLGADFGGSSDLRAMLAKNEVSFRAENKAGIGVVGDGSTDPSTLPRGGGYAFLGHGERHAMIRTEFTKDPQTGGSNMYRWVPQIQAAGVAMDELTAAVYRRYRPVRVLDRAADHSERTARLDAVRAALAADAPLPGTPEAIEAAKAAQDEQGGGNAAPEPSARPAVAGIPSLDSVVVPFPRRAAPAPELPPLNAKQQQVLDDLAAHPGPRRTAQIAAATGLAAPDVSKALAVLVQHGQAHRIGRGVHERAAHGHDRQEKETAMNTTIVDPRDVPESARARWIGPDQCPGCRAEPGGTHDSDCDHAMCPECGQQRIQCDEHRDSHRPARWHGVDPTFEMADQLGWWRMMADLGPVPDDQRVRVAEARGEIAWISESQRYARRAVAAS